MSPPLGWIGRIVVAAGLVVDAFVHADLAGRYDPVSASISQGDLFRIEAALAALGAFAVLAVRRTTPLVFAFVVGASALGAIVLYRYVDVGTLGPLPDMYEPVWFAEKLVAAFAEGLTCLAAGCLLANTAAVSGRTRRATPT